MSLAMNIATSRLIGCNRISVLALVSLIFASLNSSAVTLSSCQTKPCITYFKQYQKAAKRGHAQAMAMLGEFYYQGYGVKQNRKLALKYYNLAAKRGITSAQYKAGLVYLINKAEQKPEKAVKLLTKAANADYKEASYLLGRVYLTTEFGLQDLHKADYYLAKAYKLEHPDIPQLLVSLSHLYPDSFAAQFPLLEAVYENSPLIVNDGKLTWPHTKHMEVIEVEGYAPETLFELQLSSYRRPVKSLGSRLNGYSCEKTVGCYQVGNMQELGDFLF